MSMHSSLQSGDINKKHRNVLKRFERLTILKQKNKWNKGESVFGLPKIKALKTKIKKQKAAAAEAPAAAEAAEAAPAAPQAEKKEEKKK